MLLHAGALRVLVCTDAASEGLNLQAAGAIINYDLPWNPSKVEQRIGRIDRIGQRFSEIRVVNFFLAHSIDEEVYRTLRERCGLFVHFVGRMQPVLSIARTLLLGQGTETLESLISTADAVESEPLAAEAYIEDEVETDAPQPPAVARTDLHDALKALDGSFGVVAKQVRDQRIRVNATKSEMALSEEALERDVRAAPLTVLSPEVREIADLLARPGERLPLVTASAQDGAFRATRAVWVDGAGAKVVENYTDLKTRVNSWDGIYPEPEASLRAESDAKHLAERRVVEMKQRAAQRQARGLTQQVDAATLRLLRELGRYLVSLGLGTGDLNGVLFQQLQRQDIASRDRLEKALKTLGVQYPDWPDFLIEELQAFDRAASTNQRRGRLIGKEIDAAIADPRWRATELSRPN